ncbi:MAG: glutamate racemase [bacterium]
MLGLFDSGVGGLTILKAVEKVLPGKEILYYADNKNCPLGEKSPEQIYQITIKAVELLFNKGCNLVVLACNTATSVAIRRIQEKWLPQHYPDKKVLGIIRPVPESLLENKRNRGNLVAVMATPATINEGFYQQEFRDFGFSNILNIPCPGLASAIENADILTINSLLEVFFKKINTQIPSIDDLVLACTHYPLIKDKIKEKLTKLGAKQDIQIFDQGQIVAIKLIDYLQRHPQYLPESGSVKVFYSMQSDEFKKSLERIMSFAKPVTVI